MANPNLADERTFYKDHEWVQMIITQHYLYYTNPDGHGMILIRYEIQPNRQNRYEWISHLFITDYNPPLLLSLKNATAFLKQEDWLNFDVQIGDWVGIQRIRKNIQHFDQS